MKPIIIKMWKMVLTCQNAEKVFFDHCLQNQTMKLSPPFVKTIKLRPWLNIEPMSLEWIILEVSQPLDVVTCHGSCLLKIIVPGKESVLLLISKNTQCKPYERVEQLNARLNWSNIARNFTRKVLENRALKRPPVLAVSLISSYSYTWWYFTRTAINCKPSINRIWTSFVLPTV